MKPTCVNVDLADRSYPIMIGHDFEPLATLQGAGRRVLLVSDGNVAMHYGDACRQALERAGFGVTPFTIPAGEKSKTLRQAEKLYAAAAAAGLDRSAAIVALGGGVVGDLAGFVAGTYLRGISLIQVPTSLLAMVDSSVGGKTAVNLEAGKNLVGCFHQPSAVVVNLATMQTLPEREFCSGLAEVIKYGLIFDAGFYNRLAAKTGRLRDRNAGMAIDIIARCCELKAGVVTRDERESGPRALLNFGHTFGHAIETWAGYGNFLHGEAVSIGMVYAARLSQRRGMLDEAAVTDIERNLAALGLPVSLKAPESAWEELRRLMQRDKKASGGALRFVLLASIGKAIHGCAVGETDLIEVWHGIRN